MNQIFSGKVVILYVKNAQAAFANGITMLDPMVIEAGSHTFVTGWVPDYEGDWASGLRIGVAFEQIEHFIEFSSEQEFRERSALWNVDERQKFPI